MDKNHERTGREFSHYRGHFMDPYKKSTRTRSKKGQSCNNFHDKYRANCARKSSSNIACWLVTGRPRSSQSGTLRLHPPHNYIHHSPKIARPRLPTRLRVANWTHICLIICVKEISWLCMPKTPMKTSVYHSG